MLFSPIRKEYSALLICPVGSYAIIVTYSGFKDLTQENIAVNSGKKPY
jgi:hypothetical protein